ncbi:MAG: hypothetical protein KGM95_01385 [Betaproteobacteria bacterium]|nr:hypothetical protein [Betaproteobacteria bacterium]
MSHHERYHCSCKPGYKLTLDGACSEIP